MAITRRQFVTRLGALAAAAGFSQVEASKIMDAVAYPVAGSGVSAVYQGTFGKPRVVWLHGAECTGCSTSLLSAYESLSGNAIEGLPYTTGQALGLSKALPNATTGTDATHTTLQTLGLNVDPQGSIDIADIVIDVIDLLYHETVMGPGGDLAYKWLMDFAGNNTKPFVLVVEGALQATGNTGAWNDVSTVPWCSVAKADTAGEWTGAAAWAENKDEIVPAEIVQHLGESAFCVAIIAIGQCAAFGGYPACKPPISSSVAGFDSGQSQTNAMGVYDFLTAQGSKAAAKVVNTPGCPTNPWWFVLTVVALTVDLPTVFVPKSGGAFGILPNQATVGTVGPLGVLETVASDLTDPANGNCGVGIHAAAVDGTRRLRAVYPRTVHGAWCSKFRYYTAGIFAQHPGDHGCLQLIGCKGPSAHSLCATHGWDNQQPQNADIVDPNSSVSAVTTINPGPAATSDKEGGNCTRAGHPCMACTEKGYPDAFVPFVVRL